MRLLAIDTSSNLLSLALFNNQNIIAFENNQSQMQHGVLLLPKIKELLASNQVTAKEVDGIIVGMGPGSYTGLRIGVTAAKMWAVSQNIPVYPVSSLAVMALSVEPSDKKVAIVPIVDARRESCYTAIYQIDMTGNLNTILEDSHSDWRLWLENNASILSQYDEIAFVGYQIANFELLVKEVLPDLNYGWVDDVSALPHMERSVHLIKEPIADIDLLSPNYAQLTLAEREWLEKKEQVDGYDTLVDTTIN